MMRNRQPLPGKSLPITTPDVALRKVARPLEDRCCGQHFWHHRQTGPTMLITPDRIALTRSHDTVVTRTSRKARPDHKAIPNHCGPAFCGHEILRQYAPATEPIDLFTNSAL